MGIPLNPEGELPFWSVRCKMKKDSLNDKLWYDAWIESFEDDYPMNKNKTEVANNVRK